MTKMKKKRLGMAHLKKESFELYGESKTRVTKGNKMVWQHK